MREIVIVIADFYLPSGSAANFASPAAEASSGSPGLEHVARFGQRHVLEGEGGWRPWLARRLGRDDLTSLAPAVIAAAALDQQPPATDVSTSHGAAAAQGAVLSSTVWLAAPLHRIAGLTTIHLDRRGLLHLSPEEAEAFVVDFNRTFDDDSGSPLRLHALPGGVLLLEAAANMIATTTEPARALVSALEDSMPKGPQATPLKRIGAEVEMWLHEHPLNTFRVRRGELPANALWLWGGGARVPGAQPGNVARSPRLFGADPYLAGLARLSGAPIHPLPQEFPDLADTQCAVFVTEIGPLLHANPTWSVFDALAELDRRFITPALAALHVGATDRLTLMANDIELTVRHQDRLKFWRRPKTALGIWSTSR